MFAVAPLWSLLVVLLVYFSGLAVLKSTGQSWESILYSYASLLSPSGYSKDHGECFYSAGTSVNAKYSYAGGGGGGGGDNSRHTSEVERARINQESLVCRIKISHGLFNVCSFLLLVPYVALVEVYYGSKDKSLELLRPISPRVLLYTVPPILLIFSCLFSYLYFIYACKAREGLRQWSHITPYRNRRETSHASPIKMQSPQKRIEDQQPEAFPLAPPMAKQLERPPPFNPSFLDTPTKKGLPPPGNIKCGRENCVTCEMLIEGHGFKSMMTGKQYKFMPSVACETVNVVYLVSYT